AVSYLPMYYIGAHIVSSILFITYALWEIRSEREEEIRKVSDALFEEMYNTKESYRDKFKTTLIIGLCLAVSTIFLTLYLFFLSRTRSTHHIVAKQKDESVPFVLLYVDVLTAHDLQDVPGKDAVLL